MVSIKGFATKLFSQFVDKYSNIFVFVKTNLPKADIKMPFRTYMSLVFFISLLVYISSLIVLPIILKTFFLFSTLLLVVSSIFLPFFVATSVFTFLCFYPFQKTLSRRKNIESNLPFVLTHMGAIAESGIPPYVIFRLISEFEEYGEVAKEMRKVVRNIETFGSDPLTAVREVAERTPSDDFKQILLGFVTTTESGGNIKLFLKNAGEQALFDWRIRRERFLQQLSAYAEFYTGILIAAPLFIIALFAIMNMIQPSIGGYDILFLTKVSIYLVIPVVNISFLAFLRGVEVEM